MPVIRDTHALFYLMPLGRFEEALQERAKAMAQDPLNTRLVVHQAATLLSAEMYEGAMTEAREALDLGDRSYSPHLEIAQSYFYLGKLTEAREPAEEAFRLAPWDRSL